MMTTFSGHSKFLKYLDYDNQPTWLNIFIHTGFGVAILIALAVAIAGFFL
jgi:hypothetical protein